ncbi:RING/U-box superfamily protein [Striga asiatica]|uniref:RBR-type E3 ubiquitin transferase n=1 Tax=Striga asiatica TaxID=4170 RepID=A0A5A7QLF0_STRAF|nr:RING/U-box superfamily protein [Striga asiatica]
MGSEEDDLYSSDGEETILEHDDPHQLQNYASPDRHNQRCKILSEHQIREIQDANISDVCTVLSVSRSVACTLLYQSNWTPSSLYDKWFSDDHPGPSPKPARPEQSGLCKICFETSDAPSMMSAGDCNHRFCTECWRGYVSTSIETGSGCLTLPCPEPGCETKVGPDLVDALASPDERAKYYRYLARSYVECSPRKRRWCSAPGCELAIEVEGGGGACEVGCGCGHRMCFGCGDEIHSPVDCRTVGKWAEKNGSEAENVKWIQAYTKPCPKCGRPIEKNQGCNVMTCRPPCHFQFCWLCLQPLANHQGCNSYHNSTAVKDTSLAQTRTYLQRYMHYYERWASNNKSRGIALADLETAKTKYMKRLFETQEETEDRLRFVVEAWEQVVECRRVLKWSYTYGYYLAENRPSAKLDFFEHLQGEAERALEKLHYCVEKEMRKYLVKRFPREEFREFRCKLTGLTAVTRNYFENLVRALENNLCEVETEAVDSKGKRRKVSSGRGESRK